MPAPTAKLVPEMLTSCAVCNEYLHRRLSVIVFESVARTIGRREETFPLLVRFIHGVHKRHLSGLSLAVEAVR